MVSLQLTKNIPKIKEWKYVDLHDLALKTASSREEERQLLQGEVLVVHSIDQMKKHAMSFGDIVSRVEAFASLVAIAGQGDPSAIPHLMAYMVKVVRAAKVQGSLWQEFDRAYHQKVAAKGVHQWSTHDPDLWDRFVFTPSQQRPVHQPEFSTTSQNRPTKQFRGDDKPWKKSVCFSHNFDERCVRVAKGVTCNYSHDCVFFSWLAGP